MTTLVDYHTCILTLSPITVSIGQPKAADVTIDEGWSPYIQATVRFPMPSATDRNTIDLTAGKIYAALRLRRDFGRTWTVAQLTAAGGNTVAGLTSITAGSLANITHRLFHSWTSGERASQILDMSLIVNERDFDDKAQELILHLQSLDGVLWRDALISSTPWDPGSTDLATIVRSVLIRSGYTLGPDWVTATVAQAAATIWQPGITAWVYLDSMLQAANLRLWADQSGVFHLTARQFNTSGSLALNSSNMVANVDQMNTDPTVFADAVVVRYTWTDSSGVGHTQWDVAGATLPKAALFVDKTNMIYPGPGAAAGILARQQGRGRVLQVSALSDYTPAPGTPTTVFPPNTAAQTGYLAAVTWHLPSAEMDVSTRGLVTTPTGSFLFGNTKTFNAVAVDNPTLQIQNFDWSVT